MSSAERMRRYRKRIRNGIFIVPVEVDQKLIDRLVDAGLLTESSAEDQHEIASAIRRAGGLLPSAWRCR